MKIGIRDLIIVILAVLCGYLYFFNRCEKQVEIVTQTITIPGDTEFIEIEGKPIVQKVKDFDVVIPSDIILPKESNKTADIVRDYFSYYHRLDTIKGNECEVIIEDTITQNKIIYENVKIKNNRPIQVISNITNVNVKNRKLYLGGMVNTGNFSSAKSIGIGVSGGIQDKKDNLYTYTYDFTNKTHQVGVLFKIKL